MRGIYPPTSRRNHIKVPAHLACNQAFSWDETAFKEALSAAGSNHVSAYLRESCIRGFSRRETAARGKELLEQLVPVETPFGQRHKIFPYRDPRVIRVLKKITRGLSYHHGLEIALPERRLSATYGREISNDVLGSASIHEQRDAEVFEYWGFVNAGNTAKKHTSYWRLLFLEKVVFDIWVRASSS